MEINDEFIKKAQSEIIFCRGDIYKRNLNGEDVLVEEDVLFQHDTVYGSYLPERDVCYVCDYAEAIFDDNQDRIEETENALQEHYLYTDIPYVDGMLYIKNSSVYEIKKKRGRR